MERKPEQEGNGENQNDRKKKVTEEIVTGRFLEKKLDQSIMNKDFSLNIKHLQ